MFLKKLKTELPYDPTISFLSMCLEKTIIQKDISTSMLTAALFTIAKTWKQPKCPLKNEIKMQHIYIMEYHSVVKKNKIMPFAATWIDLEIITLNEVSQKEKKQYHINIT